MLSKREIKNLLTYIIIMLIITLIVGGVCIKRSNSKVIINHKTNEVSRKEVVEEQIVKISKVEAPIEKKETIKVMAVGDFLMHIDIVRAQYDNASGVYDFNYNLEHIKSYLQKPDLTIANLETTLSGAESGYSGYPTFNTPDELGDAMRNAGIDIVNNMSNHSLDKGEYGFFRTRKTLLDKGFDVIGTRGDENQDRFIIKDVKGVKVGIISYAYSTEDEYGQRGLNGIPISDEVNSLMNTFNPYDVENDLQNMKEEISKMRSKGAEAIIFYMHWGEEYQLEPNESQIRIAQFLADEGVDIIFGCHPHTIQPIDIIKSSDETSETVVVYSMGNFISSQRLESVGNEYTEDGLMVSVDITKDFATGDIEVDVPEYIPTWVKLNVIDGNYYYQVVPADVQNTEYLDSYQSERVLASFNRTQGIVESYSDIAEVWDEN